MDAMVLVVDGSQGVDSAAPLVTMQDEHVSNKMKCMTGSCYGRCGREKVGLWLHLIDSHTTAFKNSAVHRPV